MLPTALASVAVPSRHLSTLFQLLYGVLLLPYPTHSSPISLRWRSSKQISFMQLMKDRRRGRKSMGKLRPSHHLSIQYQGTLYHRTCRCCGIKPGIEKSRHPVVYRQQNGERQHLRSRARVLLGTVSPKSYCRDSSS